MGLRWWVPPAILIALAVSRWLGFETPTLEIIILALAILAYNGALAWACRGAGLRPDQAMGRERPLAVLSVGLDYAAVLLLIQLTGGTGSPLLLVLVFHVIFAAVLLSSTLAYLYAGLAAAGVAVLGLGQILGWWEPQVVRFGGEAVLRPGPIPAQITLILFFAVAILIVAALTTSIVAVLRRRVVALTDLSAEIAALNDKLRNLYAIVGAMTRETRLDPMLAKIVVDVAAAAQLPGLSVMLLSRGGRQLRTAASAGLLTAGDQRRSVNLDQCPTARQVVTEKQLVLVSRDDLPPGELRESLVAAAAPAAFFVPLVVEERVLGMLGVYGEEDALPVLDRDFLRLIADLVAFAIENARSYEAIEKLGLERTRFLLQVAHNLRAPLNASVSMLDIVTGGYVGEVVPEQRQYLERIGSRLRRLSQTIGELLAIAQTQAQGREFVPVAVDARALAADVERTFRDAATTKGLRLLVSATEELPELVGDADMLLQMIENLVSNAVKYTPSGGEINVRIARGENDTWRITVADTGIGIPASEQPLLFSEFFRASNARKLDEAGTGLGLAIVKQTVEWHRGVIHLESTEGTGTLVTVDLPRGGARPQPESAG